MSQQMKPRGNIEPSSLLAPPDRRPGSGTALPRNVVRCAIALFLSIGNSSSGQTATDAAVAATNIPPAAAETAARKEWSLSLSAYTYLVPESRDYVQPTITADRDWLHLEARYNYEALDSGSLWAGCNFSGGSRLAWEFTPMLGGVFGDASGIAPGYKGSLAWWRLELYSEGEYFCDTGDSSESFFYNWSELTIAPADWLQLGLVVQRTRAYETELDVQRGFLARISWKMLDFTAYVFNPDESRPTLVFAAGASF
jgi:hypothetical protein